MDEDVRSGRSRSLRWSVAVGALVAAPAAPVAADTSPQAAAVRAVWSDDAADHRRRQLGRRARHRRLPRRRPRRRRPASTRRRSSPTAARRRSTSTPTRPTPTRSPPAASPSSGIADPVVALQGSGTADAPHLVADVSHHRRRRRSRVAYVVRDIDDGLNVNAVQPLALQYRVGTTGDFTNVPAAFVADATDRRRDDVDADRRRAARRPSTTSRVVQVRFITTDAAGSDEWVGIDDLSITGTGAVTGPADPGRHLPGDAGRRSIGRRRSAPVSATDADSAIAAVAITSRARRRHRPDARRRRRHGHARRRRVHGRRHVPGHHHVHDRRRHPQTVSCDVVVTVAGAHADPRRPGQRRRQPAGRRVRCSSRASSRRRSPANDRLDGFFVQAADGDGDGDPATSEGVYVFCATTCPPPTVRRPATSCEPSAVVDEFIGTHADRPPAPVASRSGRPRSPLPTPRAWSFSPAADRPATDGHVRARRRHADAPSRGTLTVSELFQHRPASASSS